MNIKDRLLQAKKHAKALDKEIDEIGELFGYHLKYDGTADRFAKITPTKRVVKHNRKYLSGAIVHGEKAEEARTKLREMVEAKSIEWVSKKMGIGQNAIDNINNPELEGRGLRTSTLGGINELYRAEFALPF